MAMTSMQRRGVQFLDAGLRTLLGQTACVKPAAEGDEELSRAATKILTCSSARTEVQSLAYVRNFPTSRSRYKEQPQNNTVPGLSKRPGASLLEGSSGIASA